jgi:hypothetical protein
MPASRAVLADILNLGLDPKKSHNFLAKDGKLKKKDSLKKEAESNIKAGFVFLSEEKEELKTIKQTDQLENASLDSETKSKIFTSKVSKEESNIFQEEKSELSFADDKKLVADAQEKQKKKQYFQKKSPSSNS